MGAFDEYMAQFQQPGQQAPPIDPSIAGASAAGQPGGIKNYLSDLFYDAGEEAKKHIGLPTDADKQKSQALQQAVKDGSTGISNLGDAIKTIRSGAAVDSSPAYGSIYGGNSSAFSEPITPSLQAPSSPNQLNDLLAGMRNAQQTPRFDTSPQNLQSAYTQQVPQKRMSGLRGFLSNIFYDASQAGLKHVGLPDDLERARGEAEIENLNSASRLRDVQASQAGQMVTIQTPQGPVTGPLSQLKNSFPAMFAGASREKVAQINADSRDYVAGLHAMAEQGKVGRYLPGINPANGKPEYQIFDKQGNSLGWAENSVVSDLLQKQSSTVQYMDTPNGIQVLPKTTTTGPVLPSAAPQSAQPAGAQPQGSAQSNIARHPGEAPQAYFQRMAQPGETAQQTFARLSQPQPGESVPQAMARVFGPAPKATAPGLPRPTGSRTVASHPVIGPDGQPLMGNASAKLNMKWVQGEDANGNQVAVPFSEAGGLKGTTEVPAQEVRDITNARHVVTLLNKTGDPARPETNGVLQLIDSLDKDGKLGILSSRFNRFMTTGVGVSPADDPRIVTLINKGMLSDTGTMLAHFGASGGRSPQMLQHFIDLMNTGKMDGPTLKAGAKAIADYMSDRAMLPGRPRAGAVAPTGAQTTGGIRFIPSTKPN